VRLFDAGLRTDRPVVVHERVLTAANAVTAVRLAGLPLFVYLVLGPAAYGIAFGLLALIAATDWVDGYIARRFDQVTRLGRLLDPLIDRLLLATAAITLLLEGFVPVLVAALVLGRDALLLTVTLVRYRGVPPLPVNRAGKFATACLLVGVPGFLLGNMRWAGAGLFLALAVGFTAVGVVAYYVAGGLYVRDLCRGAPPAATG